MGAPLDESCGWQQKSRAKTDEILSVCASTEALKVLFGPSCPGASRTFAEFKDVLDAPSLAL
jgi:hypothetical protein